MDDRRTDYLHEAEALAHFAQVWGSGAVSNALKKKFSVLFYTVGLQIQGDVIFLEKWDIKGNSSLSESARK